MAPQDEPETTQVTRARSERLMIGNPSEDYWETVRWGNLTLEQKVEELNGERQKSRKTIKTMRKYLGIVLAGGLAAMGGEVVKNYRLTVVPAAPPALYSSGATTAPDRVPMPDAGIPRR